MKMRAFWIVAAIVFYAGCAGHQPDPNAVMMETVTGELDRETAK